MKCVLTHFVRLMYVSLAAENKFRRYFYFQIEAVTDLFGVIVISFTRKAKVYMLFINKIPNIFVIKLG